MDLKTEENFVKTFRSLDNAGLQVPGKLSAYRAETEMEKRRLPGPDGDIQLYVVRHRESRNSSGLYMHLHGGYFINGHGERDLSFAAFLASRIQGTVVSVAYSLSPEVRFPVALNECATVVGWLEKEADLAFDRDKMAIGGYSAGANLAVATLLKGQAGAFATKPRALALQYAALDFVTDHEEKFRLAGRTLEKNFLPDILRCYLGDNEAQKTSPLVSPLYAPDRQLAAFPPTQFINAGLDPLRRESERLAGRLVGQGVDVAVSEYPTADHGFMLNFSDEWFDACAAVGRFLALHLKD